MVSHIHILSAFTHIILFIMILKSNQQRFGYQNCTVKNLMLRDIQVADSTPEREGTRYSNPKPLLVPGSGTQEAGHCREITHKERD